MRYQRESLSRQERQQPLLKTGQEVQSASGSYLGLVTRLIANGFVLTSNEGDLPLRLNSVFTSNEQMLTLICEKPHLHEYVIPFWELRDKP